MAGGGWQPVWPIGNAFGAALRHAIRSRRCERRSGSDGKPATSAAGPLTGLLKRSDYGRPVVALVDVLGASAALGDPASARRFAKTLASILLPLVRDAEPWLVLPYIRTGVEMEKKGVNRGAASRLSAIARAGGLDVAFHGGGPRRDTPGLGRRPAGPEPLQRMHAGSADLSAMGRQELLADLYPMSGSWTQANVSSWRGCDTTKALMPRHL